MKCKAMILLTDWQSKQQWRQKSSVRRHILCLYKTFMGMQESASGISGTKDGILGSLGEISTSVTSLLEK